MKKNRLKIALVATFAVTVLFAVSHQAHAISYSFENISANNLSDAAAGESQLSVDVTDAGGGMVLFKFLNSGPIAMSITDVYFDNGTLLGIASISDSGLGVSFSQGAKPGNLPSGKNVNFNTSEDFSADSDAPVQPMGVNPGEFLGITFSLINGKTFADTISALNLSLASPGVDVTDGLRIGIHVQGFESGGSEAFVNGRPPSSVPDGGSTVLLLGAGLTGLGALARKFGITIG